MIVPDGPRVEFRSVPGIPKRSIKFSLTKNFKNSVKKKYYIFFYLGYRSFPDFSERWQLSYRATAEKENSF